MTNISPGQLGYRMPAEWTRHEATWLTWPHCTDTWPDTDLARDIVPSYVAMIRALSGGETVHVTCPSEAVLRAASKRLHAEDIPTGKGTNVRLHVVATDDEWISDYGALFVRNTQGDRIATDWRFNAWGGKYDRVDRNNGVPQAMAVLHGTERVAFEIVLEGGSVEMNGHGLCLTTESCLLNSNRNPDSVAIAMSRAYLRDGLGVTQTIWLGDGIAGDDTDGHIDDMTRFVGPDRVVTAIEVRSGRRQLRTARRQRRPAARLARTDRLCARRAHAPDAARPVPRRPAPSGQLRQLPDRQRCGPDAQLRRTSRRRGRRHPVAPAPSARRPHSGARSGVGAGRVPLPEPARAGWQLSRARFAGDRFDVLTQCRVVAVCGQLW